MTRRADAGRGAPVTALALGVPAGLIVAGDERGHLSLWDAEALVERLRIPAHDEPVDSICVSEDGATIVSADRGGTAVVWDARSADPRATFEAAGTVVALAPDGEHVALGGSEHAPTIANLRTAERRPLAKFARGPTMALAFAPDGQRLALGIEGGNARIYPWRQVADDDDDVVHILTDRFTVSSLAFFPAGEHLVTTNPYGSIQFWDTITREECLTLDADVRSSAPLALSADGRMLATVSRDGRVALWRAPLPRGPLR